MRTSSALKRFAESAGVAIHSCDKSWGGKYGFTCADSPRARYNGYPTKAAAYRAWAEMTFGVKTTAALMELLSKG